MVAYVSIMKKLIIAWVEAYLRAQKESRLSSCNFNNFISKTVNHKLLKIRQIKSKFTFDNILCNFTMDKTYNFIKNGEQ